VPEDREDREREGENEGEEFEPLDKFFAPIENVDWPDDPEGDAATGAGSDQTAPEDLADDFLPAELPDDPLAGVEAEVHAGEGTAELAGAEWEELRLDVGPTPVPTPPVSEETWEDEGDAAMSEAGPMYPEPAEEHELSLDDLKNAPPEYADLPGPEEGEVEAAANHFAEALRGEEEEPEPLPGSGPPDTSLPPPHQVERDLLADLEREPTPPPTVTVGVTDTLGGPSWQEPTSEEVTTAPGNAPFSGRNLPLAFVSGIVLLAIGVGAIAWGKGPFTVVVGAVIVLAQGELYATLHRKGYQPATALGLVFGGLMSAAAYLRGEPGLLAMFALGIVFTFLWFMAIPAKARQNTSTNIAMTLVPLAWIGLLGGYVLVILAMSGGRSLMLSVIGLAVGNDIAAYAIGSLWGSRPLAPSISPRKSWEGAIGATLVTILAALLILPSLDTFGTGGEWGRAIGLAIIISVFAPLGDLAESMVKRDLGVKDMGSLIPGHGGLLDRIDSIIFAAPAAFYFFRLVFS
jgi:phosphatidate cytidylyltransferase